MLRYHFNLYDNTSLLDREGTVLLNLAEARWEAAIRAAAFLEAEAREMKFGKAWHMEVTNSEGLLLFRLDFKLTAFPLGAATEEAESGGDSNT